MGSIRSLDTYCAPLLSKLGNKQVKKNFSALLENIFNKKSIQLWKLSEDKNTFNRFRDMLNDSLVHGVTTEKLNESLLSSQILRFAGKSYVVLVHDESDIRKPYAESMECVGWVRDLTGKWVRGYHTLNTVCVDLQGTKSVDLLRCTPYSTNLPSFVSKSEEKLYETGQLKDKVRRAEVEALLTSDTHINYKKILFSHIQHLHDALKAQYPDVMIIHVLDRYYDDQEVFEFIANLGDYFVIRLKKRHTNDQDGYQEALSVADMPHEITQTYTRLTHLDKCYDNVKARYAWGTWHGWDILRVGLYQQDGRKIYQEGMLLITNLEITTFQMAFLVFELYLHRWKIESVFRFLKQVLGWEEFLIQDWASIRNLISLAFFVGGYFYEIEDDLTKDPHIVWLAELGGGKGKITRGYILEGIAKVLQAKQTQEFYKKHNIDNQQVEEVIRRFSLQL
jgi:Transposase DDE domain